MLMISVKLAAPGFLKFFFLKNGYDVIISAQEVANNTLSRHPNCITDLFI